MYTTISLNPTEIGVLIQELKHRKCHHEIILTNEYEENTSEQNIKEQEARQVIENINSIFKKLIY